MVLKMKKRWTEQEDNLLKKIYCNINRNELKNMFHNRTYDAIKLRARYFGLKYKNIDSRIGDVKVLLNDNNEVYYWLGFLLADGHFSNKKRIVIKIAQKDTNHLEKFAKLLNSKVKISNSSHRYCSVQIQDKINVKILCDKFGINSNKTYNPPTKIFSINNNQLMFSLIVGFIDGDGCIFKKKTGMMLD